MVVVSAGESPISRTSEQGSRTSDRVSVEHRPPNPRDHTVLEFVYNEMHAARFINLEPLSLLGNVLSLHFKGM